jgi:hypothetical protein
MMYQCGGRRLIGGSSGWHKKLLLLIGLVQMWWALPAIGQAAAEEVDDEFPLPVAAEREAAAHVRRLGGWYELDANSHVVEVNMVYHENAKGRQDNTQTTDEVLQHLPGFPRLARLALHKSQASDAGLEFVGRLKNLDVLYVWNASDVTDEGVAHLTGLAKLKNLHLSGSQVTDEALHSLSQIAALETLSMQQNQFTDLALEYASRLPNLKSLIIDNGAKFTDEGMRPVSKMSKLETLWLQSTGISDEGLRPLHGLKSLRSLLLNGPESGLTQEAIEELREATPGVTVRFGGKSLPSFQERQDAADPARHAEIKSQAAEGLKIVEQFLDLTNSKQDEAAGKLTHFYILAELKKIRNAPDFDGLEISLAWGNRENVFVLTSPALPDGVGRRAGQPRFLVLQAAKQEGQWRVTGTNYQPAGQNNLLEIFRNTYPAAQQLQ